MKVKRVYFHGYKSGKMLGFADIQFSIYDGDDGLITIKGWKVFQSDDGVSVMPPATKKDGQSGPEYFPTIIFSKDAVSEEFTREIRGRVERAMEREAEKAQETRKPKKAASSAPPKKSQSYIQEDQEEDDCPF
jgi:hypothetical protein